MLRNVCCCSQHKKSRLTARSLARSLRPFRKARLRATSISTEPSLYFPRIALNVFAKIGLPLISLPTPRPCPLLLLSYLCDSQKKEREKPPLLLLIDHSTWYVSHRPAQRQSAPSRFCGEHRRTRAERCLDIKRYQRGSASETRIL